MNEDNSPWAYKPDGKTVSQQPPLPSPGQRAAAPARPAGDMVVTWSASEYIDHTRGGGWYSALIAGTAGLAALVYLITQDYFAVGVTIVLGIIVGFFSTQKPKQQTYELSLTGLKAGDKTYPYTSFKSFAIIHENALYSLNLIPVKRFMPPISVYFDPSQEKKIVEIIGTHLAYEEGSLDTIERLSRRLRF